MRQIGRHTVLGLVALAAGIAVMGGEPGWRAARAQGIPGVDARVVALNIPGASAIAEVGRFLNIPPPGACANPIPSKFPSYIQPGAVLDPKRILVGSRSSFGAPLASGGGQEGSFLSIDPTGPGVLRIPARAGTRPQPSAAPCRCSAPTAPIGSTASTTRARTPLNSPG